MKLTAQEKQVLTLLDDVPAAKAPEWVRRIVDIPSEIVKDLVERFETDGLIQRHKLPSEDGELDWLFHTKDVKSSMIDDDVRYKRDMQWHDPDISYPIQEEVKEGRAVQISAGREWVDKTKSIRYEGFILKVPGEVRNKVPLVFAVTAIGQGKEPDTFILYLHAHGGPIASDIGEPYNPALDLDCYIDAGGDIETRLSIPIDLIKRLTMLEAWEIDNAFGSLKLGSTYNLLKALPRTVTVAKYHVIIHRNIRKPIDSANVCTLIMGDKHPIDNNQ